MVPGEVSRINHARHMRVSARKCLCTLEDEEGICSRGPTYSGCDYFGLQPREPVTNIHFAMHFEIFCRPRVLVPRYAPETTT